MRRLIGLIGFVPLAAGGTIGIGGCRARGRPDPDVRMAVSHEEAEPASPGAKTASGPAADPLAAATGPNATLAQPVPALLDVPDAVNKAYAGVRIGWTDKTTGRGAVLDLPIGKSAAVPGSSLVVRADAFLPSFDMTASSITSSGTEEQNPAARITVTDDGSQVFSGWLFRRFPDVHPFEHPRFALRLVGSIRREAP